MRVILLKHADAHSALALLCASRWFSKMLTQLQRAKLLFYRKHEKNIRMRVAIQRTKNQTEEMFYMGNHQTDPSYGKCPECRVYLRTWNLETHLQKCIARQRPPFLMPQRRTKSPCVCFICKQTKTYPSFWRRIRRSGLLLTCNRCEKSVDVGDNTIALGCLECGIICVYCQKAFRHEGALRSDAHPN